MNLNLYDSKVIADFILENIRNRTQDWILNFSGKIKRIGDWATPTPDYVFEDLNNGKTLALFYVEPNRNLNEYYSKINDVISVLSRHNYCGLIVPSSSDGVEIGAKIESKLKSDNLGGLPITIIEYNSNILDASLTSAIRIRKILGKYENISIPKTKTERKSYWCWWRDASHHEVLQLLELSNNYSAEKGDIYTKFIYPEFYNMMISKQTKQWDGQPRSKKFSLASFKSEKQNYKIPLCQLSLWDSNCCKLTDKGKNLLSIGKTYGTDSNEYFKSLAKLILIDGKHLDLIKDVVDFQKNNTSILPETSEEFFILLDSFLADKDAIGTRKPSAITSGAKKSYVRDEPKLWNKLGIIKNYTSSRYYIPFKGIDFNWDRINEIILFKC